MNIRSVEIRALVHATEDRTKVLKAVEALLPPERLGEITVDERELKGHHGNPILMLVAKVVKADVAVDLVKRLFSRLPDMDKAMIEREIHLRLDDSGNLYLRLDKQMALNDRVRIGLEDAIHVKISVQSGSREEIQAAVQRS